MKIPVHDTPALAHAIADWQVNGGIAPVHPVETALAEVNGKANRHTFNSVHDVRHVTGRVEKTLDRLEIPRKHWTGTTIRATSGEDLPNAYGYRPLRTVVKIQRFASGWFVVQIDKSSHLGHKLSRRDRLIVTVSREAVDAGLDAMGIDIRD